MQLSPSHPRARPIQATSVHILNPPLPPSPLTLTRPRHCHLMPPGCLLPSLSAPLQPILQHDPVQSCNRPSSPTTNLKGFLLHLESKFLPGAYMPPSNQTTAHVSLLLSTLSSPATLTCLLSLKHTNSPQGLCTCSFHLRSFVTCLGLISQYFLRHFPGPF